MRFKEFWESKHLSFLLITVLFVTSIFVWSQLALATGQSLTIKFYAVGQGDSAFIETPGGYKILVDGGPNNKVVDYLNADLGVGNRELDLVVLTHPQEDHLKGLIEVIRKFSVKKVLISDAVHTTMSYKLWEDGLSAKNIVPVTVTSDSRITLSDQVVLDFVWPKDSIKNPKDLNEASIVFKLSYGSFDVLFTGDADSKTQPYAQTVGDIEVLKVPHHGSKTGLKESFLNELKPEESVISLSANNRYGHPGQNILDMLKKVGSKVFRTDQNGTVEIVSDGETWYTRTER